MGPGAVGVGGSGPGAEAPSMTVGSRQSVIRQRLSVVGGGQIGTRDGHLEAVGVRESFGHWRGPRLHRTRILTISDVVRMFRCILYREQRLHASVDTAMVALISPLVNGHAATKKNVALDVEKTLSELPIVSDSLESFRS